MVTYASQVSLPFPLTPDRHPALARPSPRSAHSRPVLPPGPDRTVRLLPPRKRLLSRRARLPNRPSDDTKHRQRSTRTTRVRRSVSPPSLPLPLPFETLNLRRLPEQSQCPNSRPGSEAPRDEACSGSDDGSWAGSDAGGEEEGWVAFEAVGEYDEGAGWGRDERDCLVGWVGGRLGGGRTGGRGGRGKCCTLRTMCAAMHVLVMSLDFQSSAREMNARS